MKSTVTLRKRRGRIAAGAWGAAVAMAISSAATAAPVDGDLNGDGVVGFADLALVEGFLGTTITQAGYDPAADLNGDGKVDQADLDMLTANFGLSGDPDTTPPEVLLTVNDIPDDMNDVIVVPPGGFQITLHFDASGGSVMDPSSLSVWSVHDLGAFPANTELAGSFTIDPTRAVLEIPQGSNVALTTHAVVAQAADLAGNWSYQVYNFAVRNFQLGPPMGTPQVVFLDFDQNRNLGPEIDFIEDMHEFGLSSASAPAIEAESRALIVSEIIRDVRQYFGYKRNGLPGTDPVNLTFVSTAPAGQHSRLCVGGQSPLGGNYLGSASLDINNAALYTDECSVSTQFGIFPNAIDNLWGGSAEYQMAFAAVDPQLGGIPVGEHPLDANIFAPSFLLSTATPAEIDRLFAMLNAVDAFAQTVATAIAHETGHMVGLTAPGPAPGGLFGGTAGAAKDHNAAVGGGTPAETWLMNKGGSFSFAEVSGRGAPLPVFRELNWAYLHDRVALNSQITELIPPPIVTAVSSPVSYGGASSTGITLTGTDFVAPVQIKLWAGGPIPFQVFGPVVDPTGTQVTASIMSLFVPPGTYDVQLINSDGQSHTLPGALQVLP